MHFLIITSNFYRDIADLSLSGVDNVLTPSYGEHSILNNASDYHEVVEVPGVMEIPAALNFYVQSTALQDHYDAFIALGCVIRGATSHHEHVARECMRGLTDLCLKHALALGNGIITCENHAQALERAEEKGEIAAKAAINMLELKRKTYS